MTHLVIVVLIFVGTVVCTRLGASALLLLFVVVVVVVVTVVVAVVFSETVAFTWLGVSSCGTPCCCGGGGSGSGGGDAGGLYDLRTTCKSSAGSLHMYSATCPFHAFDLKNGRNKTMMMFMITVMIIIMTARQRQSSTGNKRLA